MSNSSEVPRLPVTEDVLRKSIIEQINQFGLDKLTSRLIRENLRKEYNADFSPFKSQIDTIAMEVVEKRNAETAKKAAAKESSDSDDSDSDDGVVFTDSTTPKKKQKSSRKRAASGSDSDLLEVGQKKRRAAAANVKKQAPKKKKKPAEGGVKRKTAYSVCCALTEDLSSIVGKKYMRRSDVVKSMWAYFRSNNLMDPKDKRYVLADEPLLKLFKKRRFLAFGMMKDLVPHIIEAKFLNEADRAALEKYEAEEDARRAREENAKNNEKLNGISDQGSSGKADGSSDNDNNNGNDEKSDGGSDESNSDD
ncbi:unnamed protein product [Anisakis simplex]|uniref:SWIB domain-containing protein n=1 Tax=Anisakis simplex TaxID=6269 RepID=A0A0M3K522_ANISI|nr:unnamed protein product [Anisakis simplex]